MGLTEDTAACSRCCIQWTKFRIFNETYSIWLTALVNEYCKHQNIYIHWQNWTLESVFFKGNNHMFSTRFDSWGTENGLSFVRFDKLLNIPFRPFFGEKRLRNAPIQMALRSNRRLICLHSRLSMRLPQWAIQSRLIGGVAQAFLPKASDIQNLAH